MLAVYGEPAAAEGRQEVREALLDSREARSELLQAMQRADTEPVRHAAHLPDASRRQIDRARAAIGHLARVAVLLEAHLPPADAGPVPGVARFAEELRYGTALAAAALLTGQPVEFEDVRAAGAELAEQLAAAPAGEGVEVVRSGVLLMLQALRDLERALKHSGGGGGPGSTAHVREREPSGR
ncbi:hypothetical protein [Kitasatospora sp. NPDC050543]|uniref:hypothetical protein n=1 Tax=Kitasatospora sp. NPDC050543 TaxID=3364054 RepID=UPI003791E998